MNMIEKVARACHDKAFKMGASIFENYDDVPAPNRMWLNEVAKAAIEAMKEPTEEMCKMISPTADLTREDVLCIYRAMIEAALKQ